MVSAMTNVESMKIPEGYKQTEVGVIPDDWDSLKLGRFCEFTQGVQVPQSQQLRNIKNGYIRYLYIRDFFTDDFPWFIRDVHPKKIMVSTDIMMVNTGNTAGTVYSGAYGVLSNNAFKITYNEKVIQRDYLFSLLRSYIVQDSIKELFNSSGQPHVGHKNVAQVIIPVPRSSNEQTAIANALSDVDNLIASLETLIAKKSAIKTAAMQQLLTGKKRLPGFEGKSVKESEKQGAKQSSELDNTSKTAQAAQIKQTSMLNSDLYKESGEGLDEKSNQQSDVGNANNKQTAPRPGYKQTELGEIPEDWEAGMFGDYLEHCTSGATPYRGTPEFYKGGIRWITSGELNYNVITDTIEKVSTDAVKKTNLKVHPIGTFLIAITGLEAAGTRGSCGTVGAPSTTNQSCMALYTNHRLSTDYLFHYYVYMGDELAFKYCQGSKQQSYTAKIVKLLPITVPTSVEEQITIASVLSDMDTELNALQQRLSKTQKIKQGMMQELLTGKTRLI